MDSQDIKRSTHIHTHMSSINVSLRQEAYDYLKSIKSEDESFSDAVMKLKEERKTDGALAVQLAQHHKKPSQEHIKEREQAIKQFRKNFERRTQ